jgi:DNA-binding response OmpR family regulator
MLTSRTSPFDRIRGKMAGCDAYLTKPVNPDQLYEVISRFAAEPADSGVIPQRTSWQLAK